MDPADFATISLSELKLLEEDEFDVLASSNKATSLEDAKESKGRVRKGYSGRSSNFLSAEAVNKQKLRGESGANLPADQQVRKIFSLETSKEEIGSPEENGEKGKGSGESDGEGDSSDDRPSLSSGEPRKPRYWTPEEDATLAAAVDQYGEKMWKKIAAMIPNRSSTQCIQRWKKVLKPGLKKGHWSAQEDSLLVKSVQEQLSTTGKKINWSEISKNIPKRSCKQCRERWVNHLNPDVNKSAWTPDEDKLLWDLQEKTPRKWALIARQIPGRTEIMVKVRWNILDRSIRNGQPPPPSGAPLSKAPMSQKELKTESVMLGQPSETEDPYFGDDFSSTPSSTPGASVLKKEQPNYEDFLDDPLLAHLSSDPPTASYPSQNFAHQLPTTPSYGTVHSTPPSFSPYGSHHTAAPPSYLREDARLYPTNDGHALRSSFTDPGFLDGSDFRLPDHRHVPSRGLRSHHSYPDPAPAGTDRMSGTTPFLHSMTDSASFRKSAKDYEEFLSDVDLTSPAVPTFDDDFLDQTLFPQQEENGDSPAFTTG